jgi:hypothetical protein
MNRGPALLLLLLAGCSTAPIADTMDYLFPGHLAPEKTNPYGGVCLPQGINAPPAATTAPPPPPVLPTAVAPLEWPPRLQASAPPGGLVPPPGPAPPAPPPPPP